MKALARRPRLTQAQLARHERVGIVLAALSTGFVLFGMSSAFLVFVALGCLEIFVSGVLRGYKRPSNRPLASRPVGAAEPVVPDVPPPGALRPRKVFWFVGLLCAVFARAFLMGSSLTLFELAVGMLTVSAAAAGLSLWVGPAVRRRLGARAESLALGEASGAAASAIRS